MYCKRAALTSRQAGRVDSLLVRNLGDLRQRRANANARLKLPASCRQWVLTEKRASDGIARGKGPAPSV